MEEENKKLTKKWEWVKRNSNPLMVILTFLALMFTIIFAISQMTTQEKESEWRMRPYVTMNVQKIIEGDKEGYRFLLENKGITPAKIINRRVWGEAGNYSSPSYDGGGGVILGSEEKFDYVVFLEPTPNLKLFFYSEISYTNAIDGTKKYLTRIKILHQPKEKDITTLTESTMN
jgi:hypothetical protein